MWKLPDPPANESERLKVLAACGIMDSAPDERFERITRLCTRIYGAEVAFLGLVEENYQWLMSATSNSLARNVRRSDSVCNMIVESGAPLVVGDMKTDPRLKGHPLVPHLSLNFYAGAPLVAASNLVIGTLCIMKREPADPEAFDLAPLLDLAAIATDEIELWKLNRELRRKAEIDPLTGLPNRRSFEEALQSAVARTNRIGEPVSLLLLDADRFKLVNDLSGHQTGDAVLIRVANVLAEAPRRPLDSIARHGGEEFAIVLPDTDSAGAEAVAQSILTRLRGEAIAHPAGGIVSVSIGGATLQGPGVTLEELFRTADAALYDAKLGGRDTFRQS